MDVLHDKQLDIALGNSRKTKTWKNKPVLWSELLERMAKPTRTPETLAEYRAMTRDQQSDIKDVGGFVGGYCNNGSRSDIRFRSVLCLDADYADNALWDDWGLLYGNAAAVYSTHKHTPEKPRLRLVVPLSRNVSPDEYQAIGRRVANTLGMDKFDDTTYQPQRVMYWPSYSQDGEYIFKHLDGALLDPDIVLATYHNWRDVSSWPMSSRQAEIVRRTAAKQKDPTEKGGLVGAFCRTYTIQEAIEEYVAAYQPCDVPGRTLIRRAPLPPAWLSTRTNGASLTMLPTRPAGSCATPGIWCDCTSSPPWMLTRHRIPRPAPGRPTRLWHSWQRRTSGSKLS